MDLSIIFAGLSIAASIVYYASVLRNANKTQQMQLETRQAQLYMDLFNLFKSVDMWRIRLDVLNYQFNDFDVRADKGSLFENWLFSELIKNSKYNDILYFWRSKSGAEVDFVRQRGKALEGFEAKAGDLGRAKLSRSAHSFIEAYSPDYFFVVNLSFCAEKMIGKTVVKWLNQLEIIDILYDGKVS